MDGAIKQQDECLRCDKRASIDGFCADCASWCRECGTAGADLTLRTRGWPRRYHARCAGPVAVEVYREARDSDDALAAHALDVLGEYVRACRAGVRS